MCPRHPFPPTAAADTRVFSRGILQVQTSAGPAGRAQHPPPPAPETSGAAEAEPALTARVAFKQLSPSKTPKKKQKSFPRASSARVRQFIEESCWPLRHFPGGNPSPFLFSKPQCFQMTQRSLPRTASHAAATLAGCAALRSDHLRRRWEDAWAGRVLALLGAPTFRWSKRTVRPSLPGGEKPESRSNYTTSRCVQAR